MDSEAAIGILIWSLNFRVNLNFFPKYLSCFFRDCCRQSLYCDVDSSLTNRGCKIIPCATLEAWDEVCSPSLIVQRLSLGSADSRTLGWEAVDSQSR